jgi:hypothetical protein
VFLRVNVHLICSILGSRLRLVGIFGDSHYAGSCRSASMSRTIAVMDGNCDGLLHVCSLSRSSSQCEISLLVCSSKQLERIETIWAYCFTNIMNSSRRAVAWAIDNRSGNTKLRSQTNDLHVVFASTLDRRHIESQAVSGLESTTNMEASIAASEMARHAGTLGGFANTALLAPSILGDGPKAFGGLQLRCISEFDLGSPNGTHNVSPVVPGGALQRLPRTDRLADSFLALAIELDRFGNHLFLQPLLFLVAIGLFPTRVLRGFH